MNFSVVVLAGGPSIRMGRDKALLTYGGESFLDRLRREFASCGELLISGRELPGTLPANLRCISDETQGLGPAGGILTALHECSSEVLVTLGCDMPLYDLDFALRLLSRLGPREDALVPRTPDGRLHTVGAVYRKRCAPHMYGQLQSGRRSLRHLLSELNTGIYPADSPEDMCALININTPQDYLALLSELN